MRKKIKDKTKTCALQEPAPKNRAHEQIVYHIVGQSADLLTTQRDPVLIKKRGTASGRQSAVVGLGWTGSGHRYVHVISLDGIGISQFFRRVGLSGSGMPFSSRDRGIIPNTVKSRRKNPEDYHENNGCKDGKSGWMGDTEWHGMRWVEVGIG